MVVLVTVLAWFAHLAASKSYWPLYQHSPSLLYPPHRYPIRLHHPQVSLHCILPNEPVFKPVGYQAPIVNVPLLGGQLLNGHQWPVPQRVQGGHENNPFHPWQESPKPEQRSALFRRRKLSLPRSKLRRPTGPS